jgi:hypothetical protein
MLAVILVVLVVLINLHLCLDALRQNENTHSRLRMELHTPTPVQTPIGLFAAAAARSDVQRCILSPFLAGLAKDFIIVTVTLDVFTTFVISGLVTLVQSIVTRLQNIAKI